MLSGNLTISFARSFGACFLVLLICFGNLGAQEISFDLGGGVKMEFVRVPVNGSDGTASVQIGDFTATNVKEPLHAESISGPFLQSGKGFVYYLGKTEVTEAQWTTVTGAGSKSQMPVTGKTFNQIQNFIEAINAKSVEFPSFPRTGDGTPGVIRLPTEAEWEYAARGGEGPDYAANDPYKGDVGRHEVFSTPGGGGRTREVAGFPPNPLGLHDMLGNVREFVEGSYSVGGRVGGFLLKGGSYLSERFEIRSSARTEQQRSGKDGKASRRPDAGFRLCISAEVFTSLGQAEGVKEKLEAEREKTAKTEADKAEAARLEQRRKQAEADAAKARDESERLTQEAAMAAKRKSLELAEKMANEEKTRLEVLKQQLANNGTLPQGSSTKVESPAPSDPKTTNATTANQTTTLPSKGDSPEPTESQKQSQMPKTKDAIVQPKRPTGAVDLSSPGQVSPLNNPLEAKAVIQAALSDFDTKKYNDALAKLLALEAKLPNDAFVLNLIGAAFTKKKEYATAQKYFDKSLKKQPDFFPAKFNLGELLFLMRRYAEALSYFQQMQKSDPQNELLQFKVFLCQLQLGNKEDAAKALKGIKYPGDTPAWHYGQAAWASRNGDKKKALEYITGAHYIFGSKTALFDETFEDLDIRLP